jgi:beta-glucanase (GH16 family)
MEKSFLLRPDNALARTSSLALLALLAWIGGMLLTANPVAAQQCPTVVWSDEFDGASLDQAKWSFQIGDGCNEGICGWGNNELQSYQEGNVTVGGGLLTITAQEERIKNKNYTSGRIRTINKGDWNFGRFEARIKVPTGQGVWPAFWMLSTDEVFGPWPASGEIDIMENIGSEPDINHATMHYGADFQNRRLSGTTFRLLNGELFPDGFFEFAVEKEPGVIRWLIDGVLYFTQTTADIAPENWPYDERFHILLNLAVGGNFPGSPDASTVFPQTLEVDYVRVYDGNRPHITGSRQVDHQATGTVYSVGNAPAGSTFTWTAPAGATVVSGQGTNTATIDWGTASGTLTVDVTSGCGSQQLAIDVKVDPLFALDFSFENFDDPANVTLQATTGTLTEILNPDTSGINPSTLSGEYTRNAAEEFDTIFYDVAVIPDGAQYTTEQRRFSMDVRTAAPVGTQIILQLEDSSIATPSNFPDGRHSRYQAFTTVQNQWERLTFLLVDQPDPATSDTSLDDMVILFASGTFTGDSYTFDNVDSYAAVTGGTPPAAPSTLGATTVSTSQIDLAWADNANDEDGFRVERSTDGSNFTQITTTAANATSYADTGLAASTTYFYRVLAFNGSGDSSYSNTTQATTAGGMATTMHVQSIIEGSQSAGQGNKNGTATVTLVDNLGNAVGSATVSGTFSGDFNESAAGVTGAGGTVTLVTSGAKKGTLTFTFCVDAVSHGTLTYDPGANQQTCS